MKKFGIDISTWQGDFDLARAKKEGVEFVIIRGGSGEFMGIDNRFEQNYNKAKNLGLPLGCYWMSEATTVAEAKKEAELFYKLCLQGRKYELPIYMDVELPTQLRLGKRKLTDIVIAFCDYLEKKGFFVGVYSSESYFYSYMYDNELKRFCHWVANWTGSCGYGCGLWQFGGSNNPIRSPYIAGQVVDQNYLYEDYPTEIKNAGLNGYTKPTAQAQPKPAKKTVDQLAKEVIEGKWGNGAERYSKLRQAGYNYNEVQNRVNEMLKNVDSTIKVGDRVKVTNPLIYGTKSKFTLWYPTYTVMELSGDRAVIGVNGVVTSAVNVKNLQKA